VPACLLRWRAGKKIATNRRLLPKVFLCSICIFVPFVFFKKYIFINLKLFSNEYAKHYEKVLISHLPPAQPASLPACQPAKQAGRLAGWQAGRLPGWQAGRLAGWQAGRLAGWQAGRLAGWQAGRHCNPAQLRCSSIA